MTNDNQNGAVVQSAANPTPTPAKVVSLPGTVETVTIGKTVISSTEEKIEAIRTFLKNKILRQYGISAMNGQSTSAEPIGFNGQQVVTKLKLPKPRVNSAGVYVETLPDYVKRVTPDLRVWLANAAFNAAAREEVISEIL